MKTPRNPGVGLQGLLAESELSNLALTLVDTFSTQRPLPEVMVDIFGLIGRSLAAWSNADLVAHAFCNPGLAEGETHLLLCTGTPTERQREYTLLSSSLRPPIYRPELTEAWWIPSGEGAARVHRAVVEALHTANDPAVTELAEPARLTAAQMDFASRLPLGHFVLAWWQNVPPAEPEARLLQDVLWILGASVSRMLANHYPIHQNTYLPSYWKAGEKRVAVLFADVRNSTPLFEIARLGSERHIGRVQALLGTWLSYATRLITRAGIGQIQRFAGDGFMATFGEYVVPTDECPAPLCACVLALHAAHHLVDSFINLYEQWLKLHSVAGFYADHNEDVDLALGVGVNFGSVHFGYFGLACSGEPCGGESAGHLEFTAIGDHVNTTQRLESLAAKSTREVDLHYRGERFRDEFRLAPIIASQTVSRYLPSILGEKTEDVRRRRGIAQLKGKGVALPFFEIAPSDLRSEAYKPFLRGLSGDHYFDQIGNPPSWQTDLPLLIQAVADADKAGA